MRGVRRKRSDSARWKPRGRRRRRKPVRGAKRRRAPASKPMPHAERPTKPRVPDVPPKRSASARPGGRPGPNRDREPNTRPGVWSPAPSRAGAFRGGRRWRWRASWPRWASWPWRDRPGSPGRAGEPLPRPGRCSSRSHRGERSSRSSRARTAGRFWTRLRPHRVSSPSPGGIRRPGEQPVLSKARRADRDGRVGAHRPGAGRAARLPARRGDRSDRRRDSLKGLPGPGGPGPAG